MPSPHAAILKTAREVFGYERLHPGQKEAIAAVLDGRDTLVVMPTGSGKSAIYQIATLLLDGAAVVVSPLIALQRDQVESIERQDLDAAAVNSTMDASEQRDAWRDLRKDNLNFLFLAPEQFNDEATLERLRRANPVLFVVDEAHCISEWGHDFRPEYLRLGTVVEALGRPTVLALTATAAPPVREEIVERLGMRDPRIVVRGFNRPNIWLGVESFADADVKTRSLLERVEESPKPGIVYTATRKHAESIANALSEQGVKAAHYHAGMKGDEREAIQEAFMNNAIEVIVATTAFGMGIDKPNVRFVFHYDIPDALDSYYQEIGRAGRDGEPARAILFYRPEDLGLQRFFAGGGQVDLEEVEQVAAVVHEHGEPVDPRTIQDETGLSQSKLSTAISRLESVGAVDVLPTGAIAPVQDDIDLEEAVAEAAQAQEHHKQFTRSRIEMMRGYAELDDCRRGYLLNYFGEEIETPCGYCDNCEAGIVVPRDEAAQPFPLNSRVAHGEWGDGLVVRYEGDKMVVLFDTVGYKTLDAALVAENHLLRAI